MLITFSPFIILIVVSFFFCKFFYFELKSFEGKICFVLGLSLIFTPLGIYCLNIANRIGEKLPFYEVVIEQEEFPECGIIIEKRQRKFEDWRHILIANVPPPKVRKVWRMIE